MGKESRNEIRPEIIWENRNRNKPRLSQCRIVALLQKFCVKSLLKTDIFPQKILIFLLPQKQASASPPACCSSSRENLLQCRRCRSCSAPLHSFLYGYTSGTRVPTCLSGCLFPWNLTCGPTAQAVPSNPQRGFGLTYLLGWGHVRPSHWAPT